MPTEPLDILLALAPPLVVLILMVGMQWGGAKAGIVGWLVALGLGLTHFGAGGEVTVYAHVRAIILTIDVVLIVWSALLLYFVINNARALRVISDWFTDLTDDKLLQVLLLGWVFTSFLQGVGGFGVPVAIVAPLLVGLGLSPLVAIVVPSIGHAWAVTFGSLGSSFITMVGVTGISGEELAPSAALLLGGCAILCGVLVAQVYGGWRGVWRSFPVVLLIGLVMAIVQYLVATNGLWNIGSATAGLAGLITGYWVTRVTRKPDRPNTHELETISRPISWEAPTTDKRKRPNFQEAILGYMILVILALLINGIEPIKEVVNEVRVSISVPEVSTDKGWVTDANDDLGLNILSHTGTILIISSMITFLYFSSRGYYLRGAWKDILAGVRKKGVKPAIGILTMVAMAKIMENTGMTRTLAEWMSGAVPADLYAYVATGIGALGAFMTGSNTNSNAIFSSLQMDTAVLLSLSVPVVLGIQTAAAAIASLLAPAKIMVGASTVDMSGNEGIVLRKLLIYGGTILLFIALMGYALLQSGYEG